MKKVLMLTYNFPPLGSVGASIRLVKFIKYLKQMGWKSYVVTIKDHNDYLRIPRNAFADEDAREAECIYRTTCLELRIGWVNKEAVISKASRGVSVLATLVSKIYDICERYIFLPDMTLLWIPFATYAGWKAIKEQNIDVICASAPPHSVLLTGVLLRLITGKPLVVDFRDDWIDSPFFQSKWVLARWWERILERWVIRRADKVIAVTERSRQVFEKRYKIEHKDKFTLITNGCDLDNYRFLWEEGHKRGRDKKFTIVHAGIVPEGRNPIAFFKALKKIQSQEKGIFNDLDVYFLGYMHFKYRRALEDLRIGDAVKELLPLPRKEFIRFIRNADLLLVMAYADFPTIIPAKIYDFWAARRPIMLLADEGAAHDLVTDNNLGVVVPPGDSEGIYTMILDIYGRYKKGKLSDIESGGIKNYDRSLLARRFRDVLEDISVDK